MAESTDRMRKKRMAEQPIEKIAAEIVAALQDIAESLKPLAEEAQRRLDREDLMLRD